MASVWDVVFHLQDYLLEFTAQHPIGVYFLMFLIIFLETGVVVTPFLPGDTLLFTIGALGGDSLRGLNVWLASAAALVGALLGDLTNYLIGRFCGGCCMRRCLSGPRAMQRIEDARQFYNNNGVKCVVLARFVPIIRTFAPFVAGLSRMRFWLFFCLNAVGALLWVVIVVAAGRIFGRFKIVHDNFEIIMVGLVFVSVLPALLGVLKKRVHLSVEQRSKFKFGGIAFLHMANYVSNVGAMIVFGMNTRVPYLCALVPVQGIVGIFCAYTAWTNQDVWRWGYQYFTGRRLRLYVLPAFVLIVLGLMQGIQLKLSWDDFTRARSLRRSRIPTELSLLAAPTEHADCLDASVASAMSLSMNRRALASYRDLPAKYGVKAFDGAFEGTVFSVVTLYALLKFQLGSKTDPLTLSLTEEIILACSMNLSFVTIGLALMEMDYRTSSAVAHKVAMASMWCQFCHLCFRISEVGLRTLTVVSWLIVMRPLKYPGPVGVFVSYLLGVLILRWKSGREKIPEAHLFLGIPLFLANIMQFVDIPGYALPARQISRLIIPIRFIELLAMLVSAYLFHSHGGKLDPETMVNFMFHSYQQMGRWSIGWIVALVSYVILVCKHARFIQPHPDLHSAVVDGKVEELRALVVGQDLVFNVNRYSSNGRTPLHEAVINRQADCMQVLLQEGGADIRIPTKSSNETALHLAVRCNCLRQLDMLLRSVRARGQDYSAVLDAQDRVEDTALHLAVKKHAVKAVQLLVQAGANTQACDGQHRTPEQLCLQISFGRLETRSQILTSLSQEHRETQMIFQTWNNNVPLLPEQRTEPTFHDCVEDEFQDCAESHSHIVKAVPLLHLSPEQAQSFLDDEVGSFLNENASSASAEKVPGGLSSCVLSAGLGALSRAFLQPILENEELVPSLQEQRTISLNQFRKIALIGEGCFGVVWEARMLTTGKHYALKELRRKKYVAQSAKDKAHTEEYLLRTMDHPFIVRLHWAFQTSGPESSWYLVMDLCAGGDLNSFLCRHGQRGLELTVCAHFMGQVLLAIAYLHAAQIVFRDLKPENVVLTEDSQAAQAKITDFGLAKRPDKDGKLPTTMCGSPGYIAPEVLEIASGLSEAYTNRVDMYSFGVSLYVIASGGVSMYWDDKARGVRKEFRVPPKNPCMFTQKMTALRGEQVPRRDIVWPDESTVAFVEHLTRISPESRPSAQEAMRDPFFSVHLQKEIHDLLPKTANAGSSSSI